MEGDAYVVSRNEAVNKDESNGFETCQQSEVDVRL